MKAVLRRNPRTDTQNNFVQFDNLFLPKPKVNENEIYYETAFD